MKAIILSQPEIAKLCIIKDPVLQRDNQVKIKVKSAGLCGSDMHKINSSRDTKKYVDTLILGHEFSGIVHEIGEKVIGFKVGDRVTAIPLIYKNLCESVSDCNLSFYSIIGSIGKTVSGAFSEYVILPLENIRKIPEYKSFDEMALVDVAAVGVHIYNLSGRPINKTIAIFGDGAIGLTCLQIFRYFNNKTCVIGKHNSKKVKALGGEFISLFYLKNSSFDVIIESVGRAQDETLQEAIRLVKPSGKIVVGGVFDEGYLGKINFRKLFYKEGIIQGANSYGVNEFDEALSLMIQGSIKMGELITHKFSLEDFNKGVYAMNHKSESGAIKIIYRSND